jgi:two-component system, OmpR family, response regulator
MAIAKVLLVDDDPNVRKLAKMSLERVGHWQVAVAESGAEAMAIVVAEKPDVILLDMMMPGMDGTMILSQLKQLNEIADVPVIFLTAKVQMHEIEEYLSSGAAGVITKPFDPLLLPKQITEIVCPN